MIGRVVLVLAMVGIFWIFLRLLTQVSISRRKQLGLQLEGFELGNPAILYFSSVHCHPCQTIQWPVIAELKANLQKHLQVIEIDALENPEIAKAWGVLSLPTTYIIDSKGTPRKVNQGHYWCGKFAKAAEHNLVKLSSLCTLP